jgi:hypothetical protein
MRTNKMIVRAPPLQMSQQMWRLLEEYRVSEIFFYSMFKAAGVISNWPGCSST